MNRSERLRAERKKLGMSAENFAKMIGVSHCTIERLEKDETRWSMIKAKTADKIEAFYDSLITDNQIKDEPKLDRHDDEDMFASVTFITKPEPKVVKPNVKVEDNNDNLTDLDVKTLTLIEFTYEGLSEAKSHDEFVANVNMLKRILKKY